MGTFRDGLGKLKARLGGPQSLGGGENERDSIAGGRERRAEGGGF